MYIRTTMVGLTLCGFPGGRSFSHGQRNGQLIRIIRHPVRSKNSIAFSPLESGGKNTYPTHRLKPRKLPRIHEPAPAAAQTPRQRKR